MGRACAFLPHTANLRIGYDNVLSAFSSDSLSDFLTSLLSTRFPPFFLSSLLSGSLSTCLCRFKTQRLKITIPLEGVSVSLHFSADCPSSPP